MCGFAAAVALNSGRPEPGLIARMTSLLAHRGPDAEGSFAEHAFAVGFRRLAIFDLSPAGHQPMQSADGRYVIVFNGAIYNFVELRAELGTLGHSFRSTGDTEVLLTAYREWGEACLPRLNGMWAFLVYDRSSKQLFGARDRYGIKPLYTYRDAQQVLFASEIKAIRDSGATRLVPDRGSIARFLLDDRLDDSERTFYEGVVQVEAGSAFVLGETGVLRTWRYAPLQPACDVGDPVQECRKLFDDAISLRMRGDVPVGVQLSGGLDSTAIACRTALHWVRAGRAPGDLKAICYQASEFDESPQIEATLRQTGASQLVLDAQPGELWSSIERHLWHQDEPVHSFTSLVGFKLMELTRAHGIKVLLNGQGADEVFAGYGNYFPEYWADLIRGGAWGAAWREMSNFAASQGVGRRRIVLGALAKAMRQSLFVLPGYSWLSRARMRGRVDTNPWVSRELKQYWVAGAAANTRGLDAALRCSVQVSPLPLFLRVEDRNAMAHGVEVRLPFLDHRLVELAFGLGAAWKLKGPHTKYLLRKAMQGRIPDVVRLQTRKYGFPTSVETLFRGALYEPLRDLLASRFVRESGLWNRQTVTTALEQHRRGEHNHGAQLFDVAQLCLWLEGTHRWPQRGG